MRQLAIKPMQRAKYFCTGALDINKWGHYALNVPLYTHFTSPIRRYCDLIVHRLLQSALLGETSNYDTDTVSKIAKRCNERKFSSKDA
jgi:protein SSD1